MVVVSRASMSTGIPLLVGAGPLPELRMREACTALADCWGLDLSHICEGESPLKLLSDSAAQQGLVRLSGDAARQRPEGGSWLDALADWRHPLLLLVAGDQQQQGMAPVSQGIKPAATFRSLPRCIAAQTDQTLLSR